MKMTTVNLDRWGKIILCLNLFSKGGLF